MSFATAETSEKVEEETSISSSSSSSSSSSASSSSSSSTNSLSAVERQCTACKQYYDLTVKTGETCPDWGFKCHESATPTLRHKDLHARCCKAKKILDKMRDNKDFEQKRLDVCIKLDLTKRNVMQLIQARGRRIKNSIRTLVKIVLEAAVIETLEKAPTCKTMKWEQSASLETDEDTSDTEAEENITGRKRKRGHGDDVVEEEEEEKEEEEARPPLIQMNTKSLKLICDQLEISKTMKIGKNKATKETERILLVRSICGEEAVPGSQPANKVRLQRERLALQQKPRGTIAPGATLKKSKRSKKEEGDVESTSYISACGLTKYSYSKYGGRRGYGRKTAENLILSQSKERPRSNAIAVQIHKSKDGRREKAIVCYTGTKDELVLDLDFLIDELWAERVKLISNQAAIDALGNDQDAARKTHRLLPTSPVHGPNASPVN